jgi:hypothetical protein
MRSGSPERAPECLTPPGAPSGPQRPSRASFDAASCESPARERPCSCGHASPGAVSRTGSAKECDEGGPLRWHALVVTEDRAWKEASYIMLHVGLDLSRKRVDVCLISDQGEFVDELAAPFDEDGLCRLTERVAAKHAGRVRAVVESSCSPQQPPHRGASRAQARRLPIGRSGNDHLDPGAARLLAAHWQDPNLQGIRCALTDTPCQRSRVRWLLSEVDRAQDGFAGPNFEKAEWSEVAGVWGAKTRSCFGSGRFDRCEPVVSLAPSTMGGAWCWRRSCM